MTRARLRAGSDTSNKEEVFDHVLVTNNDIHIL
jgi:hypothetical protein